MIKFNIQIVFIELVGATMTKAPRPFQYSVSSRASP